MCEKRPRKIRRGSHITRLREARRLQRLQLLNAPVRNEESRTPTPVPSQSAANKAAHTRLMLELAWRTIILMQKNRIIQQKINSLKKETSEYVAAIMKNPENKRRYLENVRKYNLSKQQSNTNVDTNVEPSS